MIIIGSDHGGFERKEEIKKYLGDLNYQFEDVGTNDITSTDYPIFAFKVAEKVKNSNNIGILICTTGIGVSIAANKVRGIRCAKVDNIEEAKMTRLHNDSNILAISAKNEDYKEIIKAFIETNFSNEERHIRRINLISEYERKNEC